MNNEIEADGDALAEVEQAVYVEAAPEEVWEGIVGGGVGVEWLGIQIEPRRGGDVSMPGRDMIGAVEDIEPGERITWTWRDRQGEPSQVTITVAATGTGTRVTVVERLLRYEITAYPPVVLDAA